MPKRPDGLVSEKDIKKGCRFKACRHYIWQTLFANVCQNIAEALSKAAALFFVLNIMSLE